MVRNVIWRLVSHPEDKEWDYAERLNHVECVLWRGSLGKDYFLLRPPHKDAWACQENYRKHLHVLHSFLHVSNEFSFFANFLVVFLSIGSRFRKYLFILVRFLWNRYRCLWLFGVGVGITNTGLYYKRHNQHANQEWCEWFKHHEDPLQVLAAENPSRADFANF